MKVEEKIGQKKTVIDQELKTILSQGDSILFQAMHYAVLSGGKRFRPLLTLSTGESFGFSQGVLLPFACAIELIHNYSLIHDDLPLLDDDDFRRGRPTCHRVYGEDIALLAGDGLLTLAFELLAQAPLKKENQEIRGEIIAQVSQFAGVEGMIGGQFLDLTLSPEEITPEEYHALILKKTGALIIASVKIGGILAGVSVEQLDALTEYGQNVGLAFQTRDDILDARQDTSVDEKIRPNSVALFGLEESKQRLASHVDLAVAALNKISLSSEELCFLAKRLLNIGKGDRDA
jgi:geranylgeranyl diphosphate synthase type II